MKTSFELSAEFRDDAKGKGASRRLRRMGKVPAILYGGHRDPKGLALDHQKLLTLLDNERFYSTILSVKVGDQSQAVILKDVQRHPARHAIVHVDLQRVVENEKIRIRIPIHFKGESIAIGVKTQGGIVSHQKTDLEVSCLPKDLPEFIEIDVSGHRDGRLLVPCARHDARGLLEVGHLPRRRDGASSGPGPRRLRSLNELSDRRRITAR